MAFNVENFTSVIASKGLASSNKFEVAIHFPDGLEKKDLSLMCDTVSIAGKNINSVADIKYGIRREVAYNAPSYEPVSLSFYCTEELTEKRLLDNWQGQIVRTNSTSNPNELGASFDVGYYDNYAKSSKIVVTKLSVTGEPVYKHEYLEVYPKTVSSIELSHATTSAPMKVTATFNYIRWRDSTTS